MSPRPHTCKIVAVFGLFLLLLASGGCTGTFTKAALPFLSANAEEASSSPTESCFVELRGELGKPRKTTIPVTGETRVQDVLEASRATAKFRKMNVFIVRAAPRHPEQRVKLVCNYDSGARQVTWDTDYAVLPGDRVIAVENTSTIVDDMVERMIGPVLASKKR